MKYLGPSQSGSFAGDTASRNRFGQYIRRRAVPVQPRTSFQLNVRSRLATNAAAWRALTDIQRAGWASLGSQMQRADSLGQLYTLNGFLAYCSINNNMTAAGQGTVADAPALDTPDAPATVLPTVTTLVNTVAFTPTPIAANEVLFIFCSPQLSLGRSFAGDYRLIQVSATAAASPVDIEASYNARFGTPVAGNRIFYSVQLYRNGFLSAPTAASVEVT